MLRPKTVICLIFTRICAKNKKLNNHRILETVPEKIWII
jgi:hypothetical protein